ncbi:hypothetical protein [Olleya sp. ITB9]|uniref:hypothetical protein n=1 Tax=Olleya sp. ITB9 TaxID=1715648 RepID=UPI0006D01982|nr:hypothetical protein [Olleya sp. ITB9]
MLLRKLILLLYILQSVTSQSQNINLKIETYPNAESKIIQYNKHHSSFKSITNEIKAFQNQLINAGYLNNEVTEISTKDSTNYKCIIILKNKIKFVHIYLDKKNTTDSLYQELKLTKSKNKNYYISEYTKLEKNLELQNRIINNKGYPFSELSLIEIQKKNDSTLTGKLKIDTNEKKRVLNRIVIKGYEKFPKSYLRHFLKIKKDKTFNLDEINTKTISLNNLNFSKQIKSPEVLFLKDSTKLYIYLEKTPSNNFDGYLGFATNENSNKIKFNGYLNLNLINNLNYGESLHLEYKSDETEQKNFNLTTNLPYIFNSPIGIEASLSILKRDSTFINTNQKVDLFYQLNDKHSIYTGISTTESSDLTNKNTNLNIIDYTNNFFNIKYQYIKHQKDDLLFPIQTFAKIETGYGSRKSNTNNLNQTLINIDANHIFNLNNKNSISFRTSIKLLNSENYLENELFRFGGINSIRGFTENSLTANNLYTLNTEYRYRLSNSVFVNSIIDVATFKNNLIKQERNLYGFGFGFGVLTKGGLLRFIYANGKQKNEAFNFSNSKIHLSIKTIF